MAIAGSMRMYAGEDVLLTDQIYQADGATAQDVTGWAVLLTVTDAQGREIISKTGTSTAPTSGLVSFALASEDTALLEGLYAYSVSRTDPGAVTVLSAGSLRVVVPR